MDSLTHVVFARRLLEISQQPSSSCIGALFPQIDRQPAYHHRLVAHQVEAVPACIEAWACRDDPDRVVSGHLNGEKVSYFLSRLVAEWTRMTSWVAKTEPSGTPVDRAAPSIAGMKLAYVSHLYNDAYNNPVQPFAPRWVVPSGHWSLFESIDPFELRRRLYADSDPLDALRSAHFGEGSWSQTIDADSLVFAMLLRLASLVPEGVSAPTREDVAEFAGCLDLVVDDRDVAIAEDLLRWHEDAFLRSLKSIVLAAPVGGR